MNIIRHTSTTSNAATAAISPMAILRAARSLALLLLRMGVCLPVQCCFVIILARYSTGCQVDHIRLLIISATPEMTSITMMARFTRSSLSLWPASMPAARPRPMAGSSMAA